MTNLRDTTTKRVHFTRELVEKFGIEGPVPIISVEHFDLPEHRAGIVFECEPSIAAKMVFKHTHRIASPEEHAQFRVALQERTDKLEKQEADRRMREGKFAVITQPSAPGPDLSALLAQLQSLQAELSAMKSERSAERSVKKNPA